MINTGPRIDTHTHCRDFSQAYKATIRQTMDLARSQGVVAICDMPNTDPPITTRDVVKRRLELAAQEGVTDGYYLYMGATADPTQLREAVEVVRENPKVVGMKLYAGTSVGNLAIPQSALQAKTYRELSRLGYDGILAVHCEREGMFKMDLWNPKVPSTWNDARPPEAEVESVRDQIKFALETGFQGRLHIAHISTPGAVALVEEAKGKLRITCAATPHHLMYSTADMNGDDGIMYKVNPPLRDKATVQALRACLRAGQIDWIETDHAPHTQQDKKEQQMSGIRSLDGYADFIDSLLKDGFTERQIRDLTYSNIKRTFTKIQE